MTDLPAGAPALAPRTTGKAGGARARRRRRRPVALPADFTTDAGYRDALVTIARSVADGSLSAYEAEQVRISVMSAYRAAHPAVPPPQPAPRPTSLFDLKVVPDAR